MFEQLTQLCMGTWQHTHTVTTTEVSPELGELTEIPDDVSVVMIPLCYIVDAVEPFKLHPTFMSYLNQVFEHLKQLWMGIWQHTHTVTTTEFPPDLGEFAEILDDVSVKTIPLCYR